jgi:nucleotide-binding universal stress UspA family protein
MIEASRILVALKDPDQVEELTALACMLAQAGKGKEIHALHVIQIPRSLPLETELTAEIDAGEAMLARAQAVAEERFDLEIRTELLQAREAAPAILEEAKEKGVDLIILGYNRRWRFGDRLLQATTLEYVVRHASCQVLLSMSPTKGA